MAEWSDARQSYRQVTIYSRQSYPDSMTPSTPDNGTPSSRDHPNIRMMERSQVTLMEAYLSGDTGVTWKEETVEKFLWKCRACGLVWQMQHEAIACAGRKHAPSYFRCYGGYVENGVHRGGAQHVFHARRREQPEPIPVVA